MVNLLVIFRGIHRVNFGALQLLTILRRQNFQTGPPVWVGRVSNGVASCYTTVARSCPAQPQPDRSNVGPVPANDGDWAAIAPSAGRRPTTIAPPSHQRHTAIALRLGRGWRAAGTLLGHCWGTVGARLARGWRAAGTQRKAPAQPLGWTGAHLHSLAPELHKVSGEPIEIRIDATRGRLRPPGCPVRVRRRLSAPVAGSRPPRSS